MQTYSNEFKKLYHRDSATGNYDATIIRIYLNVASAEELRVMYSELLDDVEDGKNSLKSLSNVKSTVTGGMVLTIVTLDSLQQSQITSTIICLGIIAIVLICIFRNILVGTMHLVPVLLSTCWILGTMFAFGIPINVLTVTVTALGIGMGIDYAIHVGQRFREERQRHDIDIAAVRTVTLLWRPLVISSMTTIAGFSVLILAPMPIMNQYGIICAFSLLYSFLAAMFVFPLVLVAHAKVSKRFHAKKRYKLQ
jgi:predicted RND superfamily exporter protein